MRHFPDVEQTTIHLCRSSDLPLFAEIDSRFDRRKFVGSPCFYLDKTKRLSIKCDDVDLAGNRDPLAIAAYRDFEIRQRDAVAGRDEILDSEVFTAFAKRRTLHRLDINYR